MPQSTSQKLGIKPNSTTLVLGKSRAEVLGLIGELPDDAVIVEETLVLNESKQGTTTSADLVILFANDVISVLSFARAGIERMDVAGRFWIAYRKGANRKTRAGESEPLHRDTLQAALSSLGLDGVTLISLDDTWSAMRVKQA